MNTICFKDYADEDCLHIQNGSTSMLINILCLSGGRLAETESQKRLMVFLAEKNQSVVGIGTVGFNIVDIPWDRHSFHEDKAFMLRVIEGAKNKLGWETLGYSPNEEYAEEFLGTFRKLIERMTADDIIDASLDEWLSEADENDPVKCGFPKCAVHDTYLSIHGCQVCTD